MQDYEVIQEYITPCGGEQHAVRTIFEVETDDPEEYVRREGQYPILDVTATPSGDPVITTGDAAGYRLRYTFTA